MISVIIPTFNERDNIGRLIKEIVKRINAEIVVVDDDSSDGTATIVEKLSRRNRNIRFIHRKGRHGLGSAIIEGFEAARGDIIGVMDADFSHPPEVLEKIFKEFDKGADIVLCSRYTEGGHIENWPLKRKIASRVAILLARLLTDTKDPVTGFFFLKKKIFDTINIKSSETKSWKVSLELIVRGNYKKLVEIPYTFVNRKRGKSKISITEYKSYIGQILGLAWFRMRSAKK